MPHTYIGILYGCTNQDYLGSKSGLDKVADGHGADEGGETRSLRPLLVRVVLHDPDGVEGDHLDAGCLGRSEKLVDIR